jgi:hypothetical protein
MTQTRQQTQIRRIPPKTSFRNRSEIELQFVFFFAGRGGRVRSVGLEEGLEGEGEGGSAGGGGTPGGELLGLEGVEEVPVGGGGKDEAEATVEVL